MPILILGRFRMTIGRKIYALIGIGFLGTLGNTYLDSREMAAGLKQQKQLELKHLTDLAIGIAKEEYAAAQNGEFSDADAQKRAQNRIATLRYGENEYFFITDMQNRMIMHPVSANLIGDD